jgi:hypothetical protein
MAIDITVYPEDGGNYPGFKGSYLVAADYSAKATYLHRFVKLSSTDKSIVICATPGELIEGILRNRPQGPDTVQPVAEVQTMGYAQIVAGSGGLALGNYVTTDSAGGGISTTTTGHCVRVICVIAAAEGALATIRMVQFKY